MPKKPFSAEGLLSETMLILIFSLMLSQVSDEKLIEMYKKMVTLNVMDKILYDAQRQVCMVSVCWGY